MAAMTDTRLIELDSLREILATVFRGREHLAQEPYVTRGEHGWIQPAQLPPDRGIRLDDFLSAIEPLPDPCPEPDAAQAICQVIRDRGHRHLLSEMDEAWEQHWPAPEVVLDAVPGSASSGLRCATCGKDLPAGSKASRRFCNGSCRQLGYQRRKRNARGRSAVKA